MARKKLARKKMFKNFLAAIFLFVQKRKKSSFNNLQGSGINLEKSPSYFCTPNFRTPGNHPAQYSRKRNRNIKTTTATTTTTRKQSKVYFLTKYNIVYIIHMNPHQARIARKKLQKKTNENHFSRHIFPRFLSRHILRFFY